MRMVWLTGIVLQCAMGQAACGGGQGSQEPPQSPPGPSSNATSAAGTAVPPAAGPESAGTTTSALGDAGNGEGLKLAEAPAAAPAPAAVDGPKAGHAHEKGRTAEDIRALIMARRDETRACYDAAVANHPGIEGDILMTWMIDPKGAVASVSFDASRSQIAEPTLVDCLGAVIKKIQFAPSPGGFETKANYPFNFHPHHAKHP